MKKIFAFAMLFAAISLVACGGENKKKNQDENCDNTECCGDCTCEEPVVECCGDCACEEPVAECCGDCTCEEPVAECCGDCACEETVAECTGDCDSCEVECCK